MKSWAALDPPPESEGCPPIERVAASMSQKQKADPKTGLRGSARRCPYLALGGTLATISFDMLNPSLYG